MRVFSFKWWVVLHKSHIEGNFQDKTAKGVFWGYPDGSKVIIGEGKVVKARSVSEYLAAGRNHGQRQSPSDTVTAVRHQPITGW